MKKLTHVMALLFAISSVNLFIAPDAHAGKKSPFAQAAQAAKNAKKAAQNAAKAATAAAAATAAQAQAAAAEAQRAAVAAAKEAQRVAAAAAAAAEAAMNKEIDRATKAFTNSIKPIAKATKGSCDARDVDMGVSYCEYANVELGACGDFSIGGGTTGIPKLDVNKCLSGTFGTKAKGSAALLTYVDSESGEFGATVDLRQNVTLDFFGTPVKVKLMCALTKGGQTYGSVDVAVGMGSPAIPPVSATDIIAALVTGGASAAKSVPKVPAKVSKAAKGLDIPCSIATTDYSLFGGLPPVNIVSVSASLLFGLQNWQLNGEPWNAQMPGVGDKISADFVIRVGSQAELGSEPFKIDFLNGSKSVKIPSPYLKIDLLASGQDLIAKEAPAFGDALEFPNLLVERVAFTIPGFGEELSEAEQLAANPGDLWGTITE